MKILLFKDVELELNRSAGLRNGKLFFKNSGPIKHEKILQADENSRVLFESECEELINLLQIKSDVANPKPSSESTVIEPHMEIIPLPSLSGTRGSSAYVYFKSSTSEVNGPHVQQSKLKRRRIMIRTNFHLEPYTCPKTTATGCDLHIMVQKGEQDDGTHQVKQKGNRNTPNKAKITFRIEGSLLDTIAMVFSQKFGGEILLQLTVSDFLQHCLVAQDSKTPNQNSHESFMADLASCLSFKTREMKIVPSTTNQNAYCEDEVIIPRVAYYTWMVKNYPVDASYTLEVILKNHEKILMKELEVTKKVLESATYSDVIIRAGDGTEIKCHKAYLLAHEDTVFQTLLGSDLKDSSTHVMKMDDMTGEGVRALLQYLYFNKIDSLSSFEIAFQLLKAAEKYNIRRLKDAMTDMMLKKEDAWFPADFDIQISLLSMKINSSKMKELKRKIIKILTVQAAFVFRNISQIQVVYSSTFNPTATNEPYKANPRAEIENIKYMSLFE